MADGEKNGRGAQIRRWVTITLFILGSILIALSLGAEFLGLDLTPGFGLVQIFQFLVGLTCLTLSIFLYLHKLRKNAPRSLQADIGVRLAATGLVFAYVAGLSDVIRIGTHVEPQFERPYIGPLQQGGLALAIMAIVVGMLLYYTSRGRRSKSSMEFIANGNNSESS